MVPAADNENNGEHNMFEQEELVRIVTQVETATKYEKNAAEGGDDAPDPVRRFHSLPIRPFSLVQYHSYDRV